MKKALRISWLVFASIAFFPILLIISIIWLIHCIKSVKLLGESTKTGVKIWFEYLKAGIRMNKDFVHNGL